MVDDEMYAAALARAAAFDAAVKQDVIATWNDIRADFRRHGPFARMILSFRGSAVEALGDLVTVQTEDPNVKRLQGEVRRFIKTIEVVHGYRDNATAYDANAEAELSEEDIDFIANLEDPNVSD